MKRLFLLTMFMVLVLSSAAAEKVLTVPFSQQMRAYSCGQNSFRMVMGYWGTSLTKARIFRITGYNATNSKIMQKMVEKHFLDFTFQPVDKSINGVIAAIDENKPIMVEVNAGYLPYLDYGASAGHYIVVLGYDRDRQVVFLRDPNSYYVEEMSYSDLERAWSDKKYRAFTIYRTDGVFVSPENVVHFSDKAQPFGAEKEKKTTPLYVLFIPTVYAMFNTSEDGFRNSTFKDNWRYTIKLQGISFGHLTLEKSPWVFQETGYYGFGANLGFDLGRMKPLFGNTETLSPGVFRFLKARTLSVRTFNSIKPIPALTQKSPVVEISGYASVLEQPAVYEDVSGSDGNPLALSNILGGRLTVRYGLNQTLGYLAAAGSLTSVLLSHGGNEFRVRVPGGDAVLGPLEMSFQYYTNNTGSGPDIRILAYSGALNLSLPRLSGGIYTYLSFLGLFQLYYQFSHQEMSYTDDSLSFSSFDTIHHIELPMSVKFFDLVYGFDFFYPQKGEGLSGFSTGTRLLFNQFLPFFQLQIGYKYDWRRDTGHNHTVHIGFYAGLW